MTVLGSGNSKNQYDPKSISYADVSLIENNPIKSKLNSQIIEL